ncbi:lens fiber major intrinsic protein-like isoform X2 [Dermacentor andersoni]|uniref:lens fiber major intrinsic protein-like isoform X2 n=1 Tax=Dermacentor andersoni TaxID=34620 RepID=UPI002415C3E5|nr:lens fiber major intrinsic protein-like isoform X2 [Dermacentor andersoni]
MRPVLFLPRPCRASAEAAAQSRIGRCRVALARPIKARAAHRSRQPAAAMASAPCSPLRRMRRLMDSLPEEPPPCRRELASGPLWRRVFVELLGSLLFTVFTVPLQPRRQQADGGPLQCSVAMGASAAALAHCLAGDLNPAVTLSRLVGRRLSVVRALLCVAAQCSGACLGAAALYGLVPRDQRPAQQPPQQLAQGLHASQAFGVEFLGTVLVALSALAADRAASGPLGVAYAAAALFAYRFTGAGLNPARSLGPALITNTWNHHWLARWRPSV